MTEATIRAAILEVLEGYGVFEEDVHLELGRPKDPSHGDLSTNIALILSKKLDRKPRELAGEIAARVELPKSVVSSVEIAGPGFINFRFAHEALVEPILDVLESGSRYGSSDAGTGKRLNVEFVSANPTGPMNIVSARAAAVGSTLQRCLVAAGYRPHSEFYVNDAGRQVILFGQSLRARYLELRGEDAQVPEDGYRGKYVIDLARDLADNGTALPDALTDNAAGRFVGDLAIPEGGPDQWLELPQEESAECFGRWGLCALIGLQRAACVRFGATFDAWYLESELHDTGKLEHALDLMKDGGHTYEKDGALWFRSTDYGDEKDRVLVRSDGRPTYFVADIAYHIAKRERGADVAIDFLGPDHHGYIGRMQAAVATLEYPENWLEIILLQQVNLILDGKPYEMAKRAGRLVTMDQLIDEVGTDVARFFFLARKNSSHLDFDLDLAKAESNDNPGWYVKYAHARICSVLRNAETRGVDASQVSAEDLTTLTDESELALCRLLTELPGIVAKAAASREMSRLTSYSLEVASAFHQFYQRCRILTDAAAVTRARLALGRATRIVLANTLELMGMESPERM